MCPAYVVSDRFQDDTEKKRKLIYTNRGLHPLDVGSVRSEQAKTMQSTHIRVQMHSNDRLDETALS